MLSVVGHNPFTNWITYLSAVVGLLLGVGTLYIRVIYPRALAHKEHEAEREGMRKELDAKDEFHNGFLDGVDEVPGMTLAVPPAAVRIKALEDMMQTLLKPGQEI
jgi:hypothetical protein